MIRDHDFQARYDRLNPQQKKAVDTIYGPVMVVAGPGSGKTELLSMRVANIIKTTDTLPSSILCLTFTEAAATNMRERLTQVAGRDAYKVAIHTFHSFASEVINQYPEFFFFGSKFAALDEMMQLDIIDGILRTLPKDNPLSGYHEEKGWVYRSDIISAIGDLKQEGLEPDDYQALLEQNQRFLDSTYQIFGEFFGDTVSAKVVARLPELMESLQPFAEQRIGKYESLGEFYIKKLLKVWDDSKLDPKTTPPLSQFKKSYLERNKAGNQQLKEIKYNHKNQEFCSIYRQYQQSLWSGGYFDFNDMLLEVNKALIKENELALNLQERFQYVLVDEFQDTNGVQLNLVTQLVDNPLQEKRPNIMVVGDDDQAIFKFQGANVKHMFDFQSMFDRVEVVTLGMNYRSGQKILDLAGEIISQSEERLANDSNLEKDITAWNHRPETVLSYRELPTQEEELTWVSLEIQNLIASGVAPQDVAVISRTHSPLADLVEIMHAHQVPIQYERGQNIFLQEHIVNLLTLLRYVNSLFSTDGNPELDDLLPTILSFDFWQLSPTSLYELSLKKTTGERLTWLQKMKQADELELDEKLPVIAEFLEWLGARAKEKPGEWIIDRAVGVTEKDVQNSLGETTQDDTSLDAKMMMITNPEDVPPMISGYKSYYFDRYFDKLSGSVNPQYIRFLSNLKTLVQSIRTHQPKKFLFLNDIIEYVDRLERNNLALIDRSPFTQNPDSVTLMTAHKSKGLEFEHVFVLGCNQPGWVPKAQSKNLSFVSNLQLTSLAEHLDDKIRLFYVTLTRAKTYLHLTSHQAKKDAKPADKLSFLQDLQFDDFDTNHANITPDRLRAIALEVTTKPQELILLTSEQKELLKMYLEDYKLSVTHLNNFLNLERGGPQKFLVHNLLSFPQTKRAETSYGTAVHAALRDLYVEQRKTGGFPGLDFLFGQFESAMNLQKMSRTDKAIFIDQGKRQLEFYFNHKQFEPKVKVEVDFAHQGVIVGDARLKGQIDKIIFDPAGVSKDVTVVDYKTGKAKPKWQGSDVQTLLYRQQLGFYKLLIENSRDYREYTVNRGELEFIESGRSGYDTIHSLVLDINSVEMETLTELIQVVWHKILNLDFPDISRYTLDYAGTEEFISDLICGRV
jgi:DNA helicase II / ATP-dependent DNA helicase PcrA